MHSVHGSQRYGERIVDIGQKLKRGREMQQTVKVRKKIRDREKCFFKAAGGSRVIENNDRQKQM